jgi:ABC-type sugar transport system permease subunit
VLFLAVVAYLPIGYAIALSFVKKTAFSPVTTFSGLRNYRLIVEEPDLWAALWRSVVFTVGAVLLQVALGLAAALLLNRAFRGQTFVRSIFVLP